MAEQYTPSQIRNVVLVGHGSCGKTSLAEALLFLSGATSRLGSTMNHTSILDYEPEEHKRGGSISTSLAWITHDDHKINLLDTPGDQNFIFDSFNAMRGADAAIVVISAPDGVEVQTERVFNEARSLGLPVAIFINKLDRDRADPEGCLAEIEEVLGISPVPLQVPLGIESDLRGVISLFQRKAMVYSGDTGHYDKTDIPEELQDEVDAAWEKVVESVAETDEDLLMEYLETFELSDEQVRTALRAALKKGDIVPVIYGAATSCIGAAGVLDLITWALPSPLERGAFEAIDGEDFVELTPDPDGPFVAQVIRTAIDEFAGKTSIFRIISGTPPSDGAVYNTTQQLAERFGGLYALRGKEREGISVPTCGDILSVAKLKNTTTGDTITDPGATVQLPQVPYPPPMMSYVIRPASKGAESKLKIALERMLDEDPTLSTTFEDLTGQMVLQGMGQAHLDMTIARMRRKYKVDVSTELPPVPYRETIKRRVTRIEGKHKKQTGGAGQFGVCYINVEPTASGSGFEFEDKIVGGSIPRQLIPSVEKGMRKRMKNGFLAGYPIVDIRVELYDGKYHAVDSKDVAFQMAGSKGLKAAFEEGGVSLLEPIYDMEIVVPTDVMGDVMGDITGRRGRPLGMESKGKNTIIKALCPLAEIQQYAPLLKGMTGGKGTFTMRLHSYEPVPAHLVSKVVSASPFRRDDDE